MINLKKHLDLLGRPACDKVTGFKGVVTSISFDLYGCIQAIITPSVDKKTGAPKESNWYDIGRLSVKEGVEPVMQAPNFDFGPISDGNKGPAEKPRFNKN